MKWFWFKRKYKYRWICLECSLPIWWIPRFETYSYGHRLGWLIFAIGTGMVTKEQLEAICNKFRKSDKK